jgi:acyl-CoA synthetase (AMP-forming)/AMP-acid ligase II
MNGDKHLDSSPSPLPGSSEPPESSTVAARWRAVAASRGDAVAVRTPEASITFAEAASRVELLADRIVASTEPGEAVPVEIESDIDSVISMLAVWCSGRRLVLLDPFLPEDRRANILRLSGVNPPTPSTAPAPTGDEARGRTVVEPGPDDPAVLLFTSGSTGAPKGVVLSHANLLANLDALRTVVPVTRRDTLCATLPFFHSFGYLGTIWWPLLSNIPTVYHANPLQAVQVRRLIRDSRATTLLTTPTLLQTYLRRDTDHTLARLSHLFTGGEKLPAALADTVEQATGVRPQEGYGATELAPVVAMSLPDRTVGKTRCIGHKPGSAGRPLPGVALRVADPDTGAALPPHTAGLLLVKGPNVMQGYLNNPAKTGEVLRDGWYNTGDIARIDEDGFLFITDRLTRFSKIGGEMVPHGALEEAMQKACGTCEPCVAVIGTEDALRGEDLVVCYTPQAGTPDTLLAALKRSGLPNLWIPSRHNFIGIERIPVLGTGKTDLRSLRDLVFQNRRLCA